MTRGAPCWTHFAAATVAANIVLEGCSERIYVGRKFGDVPLGLFIIRGENVMLMSEMVSACSFSPSFNLANCTVASRPNPRML